MSESLLIILVVLVAVLIIMNMIRIFQAKTESQNIKNQMDTSFRNSFDEIRKEIDNKLSQSINLIQTNSSDTVRVISEVSGKLGKIEEASKQIFDLGKDISSLQEILSAPKLRGNLGELLLENLLAEVLPKENYSLQYEFKSHQKVDAVVKLGGQLISIDAKFPLENFRRLMDGSESEKSAIRKQFVRDVKKHIDDIADKYIHPDEGTYDFAMMYIPAEKIYYEIVLGDEFTVGQAHLNKYAMDKRIFLVSPNVFYAYLQVIVQGLRGMKIEQRAQEIQSSLLKLRNDVVRFRDDFEAVGNSLNTSRKHFDQAERRFNKIDVQFSNVEAVDPAKD